jgi:hypothetical protein
MIEKIPNFVEFRTFGQRIGSNYFGITKNGTISFYSGFYEKNSIKNYKCCIILYDKLQKLLGVQFGGDELGEGAYIINHNEEHNTGSIASQNFFKVNPELNPAELKGKYIPEEFNEAARNNVFIIDLTKKIETK